MCFGCDVQCYSRFAIIGQIYPCLRERFLARGFWNCRVLDLQPPWVHRNHCFSQCQHPLRLFQKAVFTRVLVGSIVYFFEDPSARQHLISGGCDHKAGADSGLGLARAREPSEHGTHHLDGRLGKVVSSPSCSPFAIRPL